MKKISLHKLGMILLISIITLSFASCDSDRYYTNRGSLLITTSYWDIPPKTGNNGASLMEFSIDINDIEGYSSYDDLRSIDLFSSYMQISSNLFRFRDYADVYLSTDRSRGIQLRLDFDNNGIAYIDSEYSSVYYRFMQDVMDELGNRGRINFYVDMRTNVSRASFDIEFSNKLDLQVSR